MRRINDTTFNFTVTPTVQDGNVTVFIAAGATVDAAINGVVPSNAITIHYDAVRPRIHLSSTTPRNCNQYNLQPVFVTLSEPVVEAIVEDHVYLLGANRTSFDAVADSAPRGLRFMFTFKPQEDGRVAAGVQAGTWHDAAGNPNLASGVDAFTSLDQEFFVNFKYYVRAHC